MDQSEVFGMRDDPVIESDPQIGLRVAVKLQTADPQFTYLHCKIT